MKFNYKWSFKRGRTSVREHPKDHHILGEVSGYGRFKPQLNVRLGDRRGVRQNACSQLT